MSPEEGESKQDSHNRLNSPEGGEPKQDSHNRLKSPEEENLKRIATIG